MSIDWNGTTVYEKSEWTDATGIARECMKLRSAANDLKNAGKKTKNAASDLDSRKVLAVNDQTYSDVLYQHSTDLGNDYNALDAILDNIKSEASKRKESEKSIYYQYQNYLEEKARQAASSTPRASGGNGSRAVDANGR